MIFDKKFFSNINIIIIICDARCPNISSYSSVLSDLNRKKNIKIAWKSDLIKKNKSMNNNDDDFYYFSQKTKKLKNKIIKILSKKANKNMTFLNCLIVGIENAGKSTFINNLLKRKKQKIENKCGVTKKISPPFMIDSKFYFIDTPGIKAEFQNDEQKKILQLCNLMSTKSSEYKKIVFFALNRIYKSEFKKYIRSDLIKLASSHNWEKFNIELVTLIKKKFKNNHNLELENKIITKIFNWLVYKNKNIFSWE